MYRMPAKRITSKYVPRRRSKRSLLLLYFKESQSTHAGTQMDAPFFYVMHSFSRILLRMCRTFLQQMDAAPITQTQIRVVALLWVTSPGYVGIKPRRNIMHFANPTEYCSNCSRSCLSRSFCQKIRKRRALSVAWMQASWMKSSRTAVLSELRSTPSRWPSGERAGGGKGDSKLLKLAAYRKTRKRVS